jgi:TolB-like protein
LIAVLPFVNMSGDPEQEYFADGMVEEIITALSRIRWLFVIARNSSFTYKRQAVDVKQVGRELGVRYVLEGSARKAGGRVRITAQLIEPLSGTHLWADRFDGPLEDVFDFQDKVASTVAGVIEPALQAAETARSANRPTDDLTAMTSTFVPMRWSGRPGRGSARRLVFWSRRSSAIRVMGSHSPSPRSAVIGWFLTVAAKDIGAMMGLVVAGHFQGSPGEIGSLQTVRRRISPRKRPALRRHSPECPDRSRTGAQPELRPRLVDQQHTQGLGGPTRHRDRAC